MSWFSALSLGGWLVVVGMAAFRSRAFAVFAGILLGIYSLIAVALASSFPAILPIYAAFHVAAYLNFLGLARPRMRPLPYRLLISWPASFFVAGTLLALPWAIAIALGFHPWAPWLPYALAAVGMLQSLTTKREEIDLVLGHPRGPSAGELAPHPRGDAREERPLRIVQISDPHLGPFMSVARLRRISERAVAAKPDLVFLTGDFLTMESQSDPDLLLRALEPLRALPGKVFACHGNHDHEAPEIVRRALVENGIELLVDGSKVVDTETGPVQVLGMDFVWAERNAHLQRVCAENPRLPDTTRIVLLHDPGAFKHLPKARRISSSPVTRTADRSACSASARRGRSCASSAFASRTTASGPAEPIACGFTAERVTTAFRFASACRRRRASSACTALPERSGARAEQAAKRLHERGRPPLGRREVRELRPKRVARVRHRRDAVENRALLGHRPPVGMREKPGAPIDLLTRVGRADLRELGVDIDLLGKQLIGRDTRRQIEARNRRGERLLLGGVDLAVRARHRNENVQTGESFLFGDRHAPKIRLGRAARQEWWAPPPERRPASPACERR
ncbi:putative phosphoesterase [Labilithrix luteola]|uniref:Putative phosphoesterase n=1 Tax=Labilithrix luteola TaxID=1391654 RepID=A0A0K1PRT3_9BACT|nr:metallophosphoesterase [Labilithrix luteola]AKU96233.1 putative phosphoesterase [Labilithrix luteola]